MPYDNPTRTQPFTFFGKKEPDLVMDERVFVKVPLVLPELTGLPPQISLEGFVRHTQEQFEALKPQYGEDIGDFTLTFEEGRPKVIFTRPMDLLEITQIRAYRERGNKVSIVPSTLATAPADQERSLPDPSVAGLQSPVAQ